MSKGLALALAGVVAVFGVAVARPSLDGDGDGDGPQGTSKPCHEERASLGRERFDEKYGNFGACVSARAHEKARDKHGDKAGKGEGKGREAVEACREAGKHGRAFGQCVSSHVREQGGARRR